MPLSPGYALRHATLDDSPAVNRLVIAVDTVEYGEATGFTEDDIRDEIREHTTWVVTAPDGDDPVVGYVVLYDERGHVRMDMDGYVHPDHQGRGIGTTLVRTAETTARERVDLAPPGSRVVLHNWINAANAGATALLEREGYRPFRYFLQMERALDDTLLPPEYPDGITVRAMQPGDDDARFHLVHQEAWTDHWGHVPQDLDTWRADRLREADPSLWFLASDGDEPAGIAICRRSGEIGTVHTLAVRRAWRGRGLGMALLLHAALAFQARGFTRMDLGVDSDSSTGAVRLYERAGLHEVRRNATYGKVLREGVELTDADVIELPPA